VLEAISIITKWWRWAGVMVALAIWGGCAQSYAGGFRIAPSDSSGVTEQDVATAEQIADDVAADFDMKRLPQDPPDIQEYFAEVHQLRIVSHYQVVPEGYRRAVLLSVAVPLSQEVVSVGIRDLGHAEETELVSELRTALEERLRREFPGYDIRFESRKVDATFAP